MCYFGDLWQVIRDSHAGDDTKTPKNYKTLAIIRWTDAFRDHFHSCVGARHSPLVYVVRSDDAMATLCPPLARDQPYSMEHVSLEGDLITRSSHVHRLLCNNSADIYYKLEEVTQGTLYADIIKPYQRCKDGRDVFLALLGQYTGADKWEHRIKKYATLLRTRKWKSQYKFPLERFLQPHRNDVGM